MATAKKTSFVTRKVFKFISSYELMGSIKIQVSDETERKFRELAMRRYGFRKGSLSEAAEAAVSEWVRRQGSDEMREIARREIKDPVAAIEGMLSHVKKSSVELWHEGAALRGVKHVPGRR